jgi:hypothetical protein
MNSAKNHQSAAFPHHAPNGVSAQRVAGMNSDSDHITAVNRERIKMSHRKYWGRESALELQQREHRAIGE